MFQTMARRFACALSGHLYKLVSIKPKTYLCKECGRVYVDET